MKIADLIQQVVNTTGMQEPKVKRVIKHTLDAITAAAVAGDAVMLPGFGKFEVRDQPARTGKHPQTGEPIAIAASKKLAFVPGQKTKQALNPQ